MIKLGLQTCTNDCSALYLDLSLARSSSSSCNCKVADEQYSAAAVAVGSDCNRHQRRDAVGQRIAAGRRRRPGGARTKWRGLLRTEIGAVATPAPTSGCGNGTSAEVEAEVDDSVRKVGLAAFGTERGRERCPVRPNQRRTGWMEQKGRAR